MAILQRPQGLRDLALARQRSSVKRTVTVITTAPLRRSAALA